ncbi:hypothetical protein CCH79_00010906, partial [Gambusia affinis]
MEREKRNDMSFSRKRSFTFGAYGGVDRFTCGDETRPESVEDNILEALDSPTTPGNKPILSTSNNQREAELFEIIAKLQGSRIDEQRCEFPLPLKLLNIGADLPLILPSKLGGYWIDPPLEKLRDVSPTSSHHGLDPESYDIMERDGEAKIYHEFFRSRYHHSFIAMDPSLGPLVLSVCLEEEENKLRVILRMKECSLHGTFSLSLFTNMPSAVELAKRLSDKVTVSKFDVVSYLKAPDLITAFDEHRVSSNFKFGVLYQKEGQFTEEDILSNNKESEKFREFLSILGDTIQLQGFTGKRHIGNDIVALVYQEGQTPFLCDVIKSHFLHCFVVVRRVQKEEEKEGGAAYQVSVTAREDVPPFGPVIPDPPLFTDRSQLREFLLTKLINAEIACYKAEQFSRLELRTRSSLLESLHNELFSRSRCMMGDPSVAAVPPSESTRGPLEGSGGFIENFKRAIRVRSHSFETLGVPRKNTGNSSQKPK